MTAVKSPQPRGSATLALYVSHHLTERCINKSTRKRRLGARRRERTFAVSNHGRRGNFLIVLDFVYDAL